MTQTKIKLLDQNTSNQIAAGEVVEKPASVVKELVENSLDAGADKIEVTIFEGGTQFIRVVDNGSGMTEEEAQLAILRHATSKIAKAEDLLYLHTLGFRGEALPSIASVANFELLTRTADSEFAFSIKIDGGTITDCGQTGGHTGTTVIVENLFYNVPARRKFLRTPSTEGRYINELLTKLALSRPDVRFTLLNNDKEVLGTPGNGSLADTITSLYGKKTGEELLTISYAGEDIELSGYIGKPTLLKGNRSWQTILVNSRSIGNRMIAKAIDHAYQSMIPKSGFPFVVLNLKIDTETIDVNVHPQKSEIKFSDEGKVYRAVYKALTDALTRPMSAKPLLTDAFPDEPLTFIPEETDKKSNFLTAMPEQMRPARHHSETPLFAEQSQQIWKNPEPYTMPKSQESAFSIGETRAKFDEQDSIQANGVSFTDTNSGVDSIWPLGQVDRTFIIAQSEDTLYLIDQHAAHERILFDKLMASRNNLAAQTMLMPLFIDAQPEDVQLIEEHRKEFLELGVDVEAAGEAMLRVTSLPVDIKAERAEEYIREVIKLLEEMKELSPSELRRTVLHTTACKAAIKAGEVLNMRQMRQIIIDLCNTEHPFTCPHGRPCMIEISSAELYKMFKRT